LTTGGPFPWFLFYCLAGALVLSGLWAYHASRNVDCSATVDRAAATAGEVVGLRLELENRALLPVPRVLVANGAAGPEDGEGAGTGDGAAAGQRVTYLGLGPLATFIDRRRIRLDRRGRYRLGPIVVFIDLDRRVQAGQGAASTVEAAISLAAG